MFVEGEHWTHVLPNTGQMFTVHESIVSCTFGFSQGLSADAFYCTWKIQRRVKNKTQKVKWHPTIDQIWMLWCCSEFNQPEKTISGMPEKRFSPKMFIKSILTNVGRNSFKRKKKKRGTFPLKIKTYVKTYFLYYNWTRASITYYSISNSLQFFSLFW